MDYIAWQPLPKDPEARKAEMEAAWQTTLRHLECAPGQSANWDYIGRTVWD